MIWTKWEAEGRLFPICPELLAGFCVPRPAAEIVDGSASDVIEGTARVIEDTGSDVTELILNGARLTVEAARSSGVAIAVLTNGSPSCGSTYIGSGHFDGKTISGNGAVAQMLINAGIEVFAHTNLEAADAFLAYLEQPSRS